jgi:hypothetical protein
MRSISVGTGLPCRILPDQRGPHHGEIGRCVRGPDDTDALGRAPHPDGQAHSGIHAGRTTARQHHRRPLRRALVHTAGRAETHRRRRRHPLPRPPHPAPPPTGIAGPDGALRSPTGRPTLGSMPDARPLDSIIAVPYGALWFTRPGGLRPIGVGGAATRFPVPHARHPHRRASPVPTAASGSWAAGTSVVRRFSSRAVAATAARAPCRDRRAPGTGRSAPGGRPPFPAHRPLPDGGVIRRADQAPPGRRPVGLWEGEGVSGCAPGGSGGRGPYP